MYYLNKDSSADLTLSYITGLPIKEQETCLSDEQTAAYVDRDLYNMPNLVSKAIDTHVDECDICYAKVKAILEVYKFTETTTDDIIVSCYAGFKVTLFAIPFIIFFFIFSHYHPNVLQHQSEISLNHQSYLTKAL